MYTDNLNQAAISLLSQERCQSSRLNVLEFGCWRGALGSYMMSTGYFEWRGVEKDSQSAKIAAKNFDVINQDAFDYIRGDASWLEMTDVVLMVDVLEHLYEPAEFLSILRSKLSLKTILILILPNIESYEIIELLIANKFAYSDTGILDRTHRYFYTPKSLCSELYKLGFFVKSRPFFLKNSKGEKIFDYFKKTGSVRLETDKGIIEYPSNYPDAQSVSSYGFGLSFICG